MTAWMLRPVQRFGGVVYSMIYATGRLAFTFVSRRPSLGKSFHWAGSLLPATRKKWP
jgi:hypothetical protein